MTDVGQEFHAHQIVPLADLKQAGIPTKSLIHAGSIRQARARFGFEPAIGRYFAYASDGLPAWIIAITEDHAVIDVMTQSGL